MFFNRLNDDSTWNLAFNVDAYSRPRVRMNNIDSPWTPYAWWNTVDDWSFRAVRYSADNFGAELDFLYYHPTQDIVGSRGTRSFAAGVLGTTDNEILVFPGFKGVFDELYFFGSRDDSSGWLTNEQIQAIASMVNRGNISGSDASAYDGNPEPYEYLEGDLDLDSKVNMLDFSQMAESMPD
jgi:hypothetical protein